jgi:DNA-binding response OmpR family regulator
MTGEHHDRAATAEGALRGRRILIVEDESMVIMLLEDFLTDIGCTVVGVASRIDQASAQAAAPTFDAAILDVNLNGQQTFALARDIIGGGRAVVFATGYGASTLPPDLRHVPVLQKPFHQQDLERTLRAALGGHVAGAGSPS